MGGSRLVCWDAGRPLHREIIRKKACSQRDGRVGSHRAYRYFLPLHSSVS